MPEADSWWSLTLETLPQSRVQLETLFHASGCAGIWEQESRAAAGRTRLVVYFPGPLPTDPSTLAWWDKAVALTIGRPRPEEVECRDWMSQWRKNFSPTPLTDKTLVIPSWMEPEKGEKSLVLKIYPGQGFGTGTHETTRLAARLLEARVEQLGPEKRSSASLLDIGTGSGILSVLAARRGIARTTAIDIDHDALENARENLVLNQVEKVVALSTRPLDKIVGPYDLAVANIVAPVLRRLAPHFPRLLKPGGCLILSGMLSEQVEEIRQLCSGLGLVCGPRQDLGEWSAFTACRSEQIF